MTLSTLGLMGALMLGQSGGWEKSKYLGKTPDEIVKMGRDKWTEFHASKKGYSTADMMEGQTQFADALKVVNNRSLTKPNRAISKARQTWLLQMRTSANQHGMAAYQVGYGVTGAGSMWNLFFSAIAGDVEEVIRDCISNKKLPMIKMKSFEALIAEMDQGIAKANEDLTVDKTQLKRWRAEFAKQHSKTSALLAKGTQADQLKFRILMNHSIYVGSGQSMSESGALQ